MIAVLLLASLAFLGASATLRGGWQDLGSDESGLRTTLAETLPAIKTHLLLSNQNDDVKVDHVVSAQYQVVNGIKYKAEVVFETSPGGYESPKKTQQCTVEVWDSASPPKFELLHHECHKPVFGALQVSGEGVLGGFYRYESLESDTLRNLTDFFLTHLAQKTNTPVDLAFKRVVDATYHVVAGLVHQVVLEFEVKNRLEPDHAHTVTCFFQVSSLVGQSEELKKYDCDDALFTH